METPSATWSNMNRLYYNPGSSSLAPHIVLEEVGEPYEQTWVELGKRANYEVAFTSINPHARVPTLDADGTIITEVVAIQAYLGRRYPQLRMFPQGDLLEETRCMEWLAWLTTTVHIGFTQIFRPERYVASADDYPVVKKRGQELLLKHFKEIDERLASSHYAMASGYSVVDPILLVMFRWGNRLKLAMADDYPAWSRLITELLSRPAVQTALKQEGITITE
jgi:glutathione S-transferase